MKLIETCQSTNFAQLISTQILILHFKNNFLILKADFWLQSLLVLRFFYEPTCVGLSFKVWKVISSQWKQPTGRDSRVRWLQKSDLKWLDCSYTAMCSMKRDAGCPMQSADRWMPPARSSDHSLTKRSSGGCSCCLLWADWRSHCYDSRCSGARHWSTLADLWSRSCRVRSGCSTEMACCSAPGKRCLVTEMKGIPSCSTIPTGRWSWTGSCW